MKKLFNLLVCSCLLLPGYAQKAAERQINFADPTIVCFDGKYYLYGTEAKPQTGIPVLQSKNLKTWTVPEHNTMDGHALEGGKNAFGTKGFWAPQVFRYDGKYYMAYTANEEIAIAKSDTPTGPFVQDNVASLKAPTKQIDPFIFFDTDGKVYLYHVRLHNGNAIWVAELKSDLSGIKEETLTPCITATEPWEDTQTFKSVPVIEGPTLIKHNGLYYLFYSANHFASKDYAVGYATSTSPLGPWKKYANNPIISRNLLPQDGTGHGDLFCDAKGNWKYVFHVHNSDTSVHPRRTMLVDVKFTPDKSTGEDVVSINPKSLLPLEMKAKKKN